MHLAFASDRSSGATPTWQSISLLYPEVLQKSTGNVWNRLYCRIQPLWDKPIFQSMIQTTITGSHPSMLVNE